MSQATTTPHFHPSFVAGAEPPLSAITLPAANIYQGRYRYTLNLVRLATASSHPLCQTWPIYQSPIKLDLIIPFRDSHPDPAFAAYIHMGLLMGFRIGYAQDRLQLRCHTMNHPSALTNEAVVHERIATELTAGRLLGPIAPDLTHLVHTSPLGLVPKTHGSTKWRLICDLSSPLGHSINDGISPELCSLQYSSVHDAVNIVRKLG